jgi:hypothetical protein
LASNSTFSKSKRRSNDRGDAARRKLLDDKQDANNQEYNATNSQCGEDGASDRRSPAFDGARPRWYLTSITEAEAAGRSSSVDRQ